jgi:hypothetical protein
MKIYIPTIIFHDNSKVQFIGFLTKMILRLTHNTAGLSRLISIIDFLNKNAPGWITQGHSIIRDCRASRPAWQARRDRRDS